MIRSLFLLSFLSFFLIAACQSNEKDISLKLGASRTDIYLPALHDFNVSIWWGKSTKILTQIQNLVCAFENGATKRSFTAPGRMHASVPC